MNPQSKNKDEWTLTSKLICPPIENVRFRWANFSRSTETIFGRMLWIWYDYKLCCLFQDACLSKYNQFIATNTNWQFNLLLRRIWSLYLVILFKLITLFLAAVSPNWWYIEHPTSELYKGSPEEEIKRGTYQSKCKLITAIQVSALLTFLLGYPSQQYNEVWN